MKQPIAVLVSDIHYSLNTLELADASLRQAIDKANRLRVPLIIAGDLHDSKANLRGECVNALVETFKLAYQPPYVMIGNHDLINEKSDTHALNFLQHQARIIDKPVYLPKLKLHLVPYQSNPAALYTYLQMETLDKPTANTFIFHQGLKDSNMGDYIQDRSAVEKQAFYGRRVVSGHYHARQTIDLEGGGTWDYIGNPYTLTFGEAKDPDKGFRVLSDDGSLEFIPTNLRKHVVVEFTTLELENFRCGVMMNPGDLLWVKIRGPKSNILNLRRSKVDDILGLEDVSYRLEFLPDPETDTPIVEQDTGKLLDGILDLQPNPDRLKKLWRRLEEA